MNRFYSNAVNGFKKVTHVIFDVDGLLIDTENLYTQAIQNILDNYGKTFNWESKVQTMGLIGKDAAKKMIDLFELPISYEEYYELLTEQYQLIFQNCELMPDSEKVYRKAISEIARKHGKEYTLDIQAKVVGTPERESSRIAVTEMKLPMSVDEFQKLFRKISYLYISSVPLLPGAERIVRHFHSSNVPIAVATSSHEDAFRIKSQNHKELFSLFNHIVCGGTDPHVKAGKPHPDIFLVCASRFPEKPDPEGCLVFEDSHNGVLAAKRANMQCVMVPDERLTDEYKRDATIVLNTLHDFKPELFGLPPMN